MVIIYFVVKLKIYFYELFLTSTRELLINYVEKDIHIDAQYMEAFVEDVHYFMPKILNTIQLVTGIIYARKKC